MSEYRFMFDHWDIYLNFCFSCFFQNFLRELLYIRKQKLRVICTHYWVSTVIGLGHSSRHCSSPFYPRPFDARDIYSLLSSFLPNSTNERSLGYITLIVTRRVRESAFLSAGRYKTRAGQEAPVQTQEEMERWQQKRRNASIIIINNNYKLKRAATFFFRFEKSDHVG